MPRLRLEALIAQVGIIWTAATLATAADQVVLRASTGRFLRATADGAVPGDQLVPGAGETFELLSHDKDRFTLKTPAGRLLVVEGGIIRSGAGPLADGPKGTVPFSLPRKSGQPPAGRDAIEVYRLGTLPAAIQATLQAALRGMAVEELTKKPYDKTRTHKTERYIDLPAPTLHDPKRMKRHQVLGVEEQTRVQAELDGPPDIRLGAMPLLRGFGESGSGVLLVALDARVPLRGRVQYKLAGVLSASTSYRAIVQVTAVSELRARTAGGDVVLSPPAVLDLKATVSKLELGNDVLDTARRPIEDLVNRELRHNEAKIREKANDSLRKATAARDFRLPFAGYLGLL